ncbi:unnamed protein product [Cylicostephanus goldi]|uniref:C2H2-type domain-containing protein n=1 Tax=Cylicostephanus goldi TaxID=71465 RepID=A0A3P6TFS7_CYLGO|nr:unnamed protein product [Cylicostephanus goldi]
MKRYRIFFTHYQPETKEDAPQLIEVVVHSAANGEDAVVDDVHSEEAVDSHVYACPIIECGMQSQNKEEVEEHIAAVHGDMQDWVDDGAEAEAFASGSETIVVNDVQDGQEQNIVSEQHPIMVTEDQQYRYYPYEEESEYGFFYSTERQWIGKTDPFRVSLVLCSRQTVAATPPFSLCAKS